MPTKPEQKKKKAKKPPAKQAPPKVPPPKRAAAARPTVRHDLRLGVDAGNITVADLAYLLENGADVRRKARYALLAVPAGPCGIRVDIPQTAYGRIREKLTVNVTSGRLFVGDVAYAFSKGWDAFLARTNYLLERNERFRSFDTGSDGETEVTVVVPAR